LAFRHWTIRLGGRTKGATPPIFWADLFTVSLFAVDCSGGTVEAAVDVVVPAVAAGPDPGIATGSLVVFFTRFRRLALVVVDVISQLRSSRSSRKSKRETQSLGLSYLVESCSVSSGLS